jgi:rubrerythrin
MENTIKTNDVRDLNWIKQHLQSAIELEFSTLPLYLSSMFSLTVQNYSAYNILRSVAMEEMVHMAIAANILAALGGTPAIKNIKVAYPTKGLPGGVEPDLTAGLTRFSKNQLKNFMRIEKPRFLVNASESTEEYPTIGIFYEEIKEALYQNRDEVIAAVKLATDPNNKTASKQVPDSIGLPKFIYDEKIDPVEMLCSGIDEITGQGEGTQAESIVTNAKFEYEESHYAKFASLYYGSAYRQPDDIKELTIENEPEFFKGPSIGWPDVINIMAMPSDGYAKILALDPNGPDTATGTNVTAQLDAFDVAFSNMLMTLDLVWNPTAQGTWNPISQSASKMINYAVFQNTAHLQESVKGLGTAVHGMMDFRVFTAFNIDKQQIPDSIIQQLPELYPDEFEFIEKYTDLSKPVFYGPRYLNINQ